MNRRIFIIFAFCILIFAFKLSAQDTWEHVYDPFPNVDGYLGEDVVKCNDEGYAFCASVYVEDPFNPGFYEEYFGITFKVDASGNLEWVDQDTVSWMPTTKASGLAFTSDGGLVTTLIPELAGDCAIIKRDINGNREWTINPGFAPHSIIDCDDGFVVCGYQQAGTDEFKKYDLSGNLIWSKNLQASQLNSVTKSSDDGFITAGIFCGQNNGDATVIKTNANGDTLWTKHIDGYGDLDEAKCVIETSSNDIIVLGEFVNISAGSPGFLWKLDQDGNTLDLEIVDQNIGWAIWSANEYINNSIITWGSGPNNVARFNRFGSTLNFMDTMIGLCSGGDKGFLIDEEYLIYCQWPDLTVTKTYYESVNIIDNLVSVKNYIVLSNYPNPFNPQTRIMFELPANIKNPILRIFNIKGQVLESIGIHTDQRSIILDASKYASGIYLYQVTSENNKSEIKKMTLLK